MDTRTSRIYTHNSLERRIKEAVDTAITPLLREAERVVEAEVRQSAADSALGALRADVSRLLEDSGLFIIGSYSQVRLREKGPGREIIAGAKYRPGNEFVLDVVKHLLHRLSEAGNA